MHQNLHQQIRYDSGTTIQYFRAVNHSVGAHGSVQRERGSDLEMDDEDDRDRSEQSVTSSAEVRSLRVRSLSCYKLVTHVLHLSLVGANVFARHGSHRSKNKHANVLSAALQYLESFVFLKLYVPI